MKRFSFPLHRVLDWKTVVAQQEQTSLESLERERSSIQASLLSLDDSIRELSEAPEESMSGHELAYGAHARAALLRQKTRVEQHHESCEQQISAQREKLRTAETERRLFDKLRGRSHAEWTADASRELDTDASDLFLGNWNRR